MRSAASRDSGVNNVRACSIMSLAIPRRSAMAMPLEPPGTPTIKRYVGRRFTSSNSTAALTTPGAVARSEEHTSELQSRLHLVCRLLLEKKNHSEPYRPSNPISTEQQYHFT